MKRFKLVVLLVAAVVLCGTVGASARSPQTYTHVFVPTSSEFSNPNAGGTLAVTVGDAGTEWREDYYGKKYKIKYWLVTLDVGVWGLTPDTEYRLNYGNGLPLKTDSSGTCRRTWGPGRVYSQAPPDGSGSSVQYHNYPRDWERVLVTAD
jgi:hypothetical protein